MFSVRSFAASGLLLLAELAGAAAFPEPYDTEKSTTHPLPPAEAAASFKVPPGFHVSVFAAEPDIRQPIAMTFDSRGRLWVAENYTYAESGVNFATNLNDRIVILEDKDGDGRFDSRKVFWDEGKILTSVEVGRGGVYALCPPQLLFIPDKDGDDRPDGPPEVLLDGFTPTTGNHHTFANGLKWGPDGWLWGRIGISSGARIGRPGDPDAGRVEMRGGIWRYDPKRRVFEAVSHGTTNPWGLDWNEVGEPFFINTVIGHFWHAIPGAHFQRMHGDDVMPRAYGLIGQHADHYHFDTGAGWTKSRAGADGAAAGGSDALGGGHAHCGLMVYQGTNWPAEYRGRVFTLNLHGRRINEERIERDGSGYVARHEPDLLSVGDPWFRGLDLITGPDGGVYISDWSDAGECHDSDGVHRNSGRIYKVTYGTPKAVKLPDLRHADSKALVELALDGDEWMVRQARQELAGREPDAWLRAIMHPSSMFFDKITTNRTPPVQTLRLMWALNALCGVTPGSESRLLGWTNDADENVRSWAVRLLAERFPVSNGKEGGTMDPSVSPGFRTIVVAAFAKMAREDPSPLVRLYLASALQRLSFSERRVIGEGLVAHAEDASDHNLGLMLWYGLEPLIGADPQAALRLINSCRHPVLRRFIARRLTEDLDARPAIVGQMLGWATRWGAAEQADVLEGFADALRGRRRAKAPSGWTEFAAVAGVATAPVSVRDRIRDLNVLFGDGRALDELSAVVEDTHADVATRRTALHTLVEARADQLPVLLRRMADDGSLRVPAMIGLLELNDPEAVKLAGSRLPWVEREERPAMVAAMVTRPDAAAALLDGLAAGRVARADISAFHARQIASLGVPALSRRLAEVWGSVRIETGDQRAAVEKWRGSLAPARLAQADAGRGRAAFQTTCMACHRLYGDGGVVGPDLTGSGRANLDYLLENIVTPSAVVPSDYRVTVVTLKDGRVLTGLLREPTERTVTIVSQLERLVMERSEILKQETLGQSLMPDGLLDTLGETAARDLVAYLMLPRQVALPVAK